MNAKNIGLEAVVWKKYENGEIRTDSDIMDLAEDYGMGYRQISRILDRLKTKGTPCEGCGHVGRGFAGIMAPYVEGAAGWSKQKTASSRKILVRIHRPSSVRPIQGCSPVTP